MHPSWLYNLFTIIHTEMSSSIFLPHLYSIGNVQRFLKGDITGFSNISLPAFVLSHDVVEEVFNPAGRLVLHLHFLCIG